MQNMQRETSIGCNRSDSRNERLKKAFGKAVEGFSVDIPIIMHGSGDVDPEAANGETIQLISSLTAQYVSKLVDAAIDSHRILASGTDRPESVLEAPLAPRKRSRLPARPIAPELLAAAKKKHKSVRGSDDYWDQPLPEPKIKGVNSDKVSTGTKTIHVDEWVGLAGVDLREDRIRSSYVRGIEAISTSSFVFPVCHDVYAYGRVRAAQAAKRSIQPILVHQPLMEMIQEDHNENKTEKQTEKEATSDPEDEENEDEKSQTEDKNEDDDEDTAAWPGIDAILPIPRM